MRIGVANQHEAGETRAALVPGVVRKLVARKVAVAVEAGAGARCFASDDDYRQAGAEIIADAGRVWREADVMLGVRPPTVEQVALLREGAVYAGMLAPLKHREVVAAMAARKVTAFAMEFLPRISRAQSMDVLSSQASIGGYKAVLLAASLCPKMYPMMITAAGTISPAKVFVLGAGVAGLQAIATARRLGAVVEAFDVRAAVEEQVKSLGARFVKLDLKAQDAGATGGYAKEQSDDDRRRQAELMARHVTSADCVIATAAVFARTPPLLIPGDVVARMKPGSVIIDLAADGDAGRGNCELTRPDQRVTTPGGVTIEGPTNLPATVPADASLSFANNMLAFLGEILRDGELKLDWTDEIVKGAAITRDGAVVNEMVMKAWG